MYCGKCGAKNEPGAAFCGACGAPLEASTPAGAPVIEGEPVSAQAAGTQDSGKHKKIGIAAVAAVVVVLVIAAVSLLGGRSDTATAERFFDAVFNADAEAIVDLIPPDLIEAAIEESGYSRAEVEEEFQQMASEMSYALGALDSLGDGVDISYNAVDSEEMDPDQLRYLQEQYDALHVDVSDARTVEVELRVQMRSMGLDESTTIDIPVIQVGRSWYIDVTNLNF
ncbi:MAG TPA: zinc ribbon domain-containing protein [Candidatus Flavonifractor intestinipullorum]|uniref:Zinc ribbon domain-containing protein n=1 Tax=Candidatus Flavonifractor intestinipullorum TaxID=2838587 RepID=A0A9D2MB05_9FIRM|nr:zinc ribbon domain-containing protein [uncultured Intestinimonas sp.]HJB56634.1 zinc ribbon domain-containing protein [Candidatus Flavonifractor intestinipullorum]